MGRDHFRWKNIYEYVYLCVLIANVELQCDLEKYMCKSPNKLIISQILLLSVEARVKQCWVGKRETLSK